MHTNIERTLAGSLSPRGHFVQSACLPDLYCEASYCCGNWGGVGMLYLVNYSFIHSFIHSFICPSIRPSVRLFVHSFMHASIHSLIHLALAYVPSFFPLCIRSFVHLLICSFYLYHDCVQSVPCCGGPDGSWPAAQSPASVGRQPGRCSRTATHLPAAAAPPLP